MDQRQISRRQFSGMASALLVAPMAAGAATEAAAGRAGAPADDADWFRQARLGMFIHWGLWAVAGGSWKGKRYYGISEWLMERAKIPVAEYAELAKSFNPQHFSPRDWARAAKAAGFKYVVITAKHHDGFAMFDSKASTYNVVKATPYGRDVMREAAEAVRAEGLRMGFYYSQYQDWEDRNAAGNGWDFPKKGRDFKKYLRDKAVPQIEELLSHYGRVDIMWFDTPVDISMEDSRYFHDLVKRRQPHCLVSSRVGNGLGDFTTYGDAEIPSHNDGRAWEAIFTHNDSWGHAPFDFNFKSTTELIRLLALVASKGGNLMLNVGPDAQGRIPDESLERIAGVGQWLERHGESVYGTAGVPHSPQPWGVATQRVKRLYLHVFEAPSDRRLILPDSKGQPQSVRLLGSPARRLGFSRRGKDLVIHLPPKLPDARDSVIALDHDGGLSLAPTGPSLVSRAYPRFDLLPAYAQLGGGAMHDVVHHYHYFGVWYHLETVAGLTSPEASVSWDVRVTEPGDYRLVLHYAADKPSAGREGVIELGQRLLYFSVLETGPNAENKPVPLFDHPIGNVKLAASVHRVRIRPTAVGANLFTLKGLSIQPID